MSLAAHRKLDAGFAPRASSAAKPAHTRQLRIVDIDPGHIAAWGAVMAPHPIIEEQQLTTELIRRLEAFPASLTTLLDRAPDGVRANVLARTQGGILKTMLALLELLPVDKRRGAV